MYSRHAKTNAPLFNELAWLNCFLRSNPIIFIRLSKNLQACISKRGKQIQKIEQKYEELRSQFNEFRFFFSTERGFGLMEYVHRKPRSMAFTLTVGCDFDVTTISISCHNDRLRRPESLCQLPPLYNKKIKISFMFMRYIRTTSHDLEARHVAVVV